MGGWVLVRVSWGYLDWNNNFMPRRCPTQSNNGKNWKTYIWDGCMETKLAVRGVENKKKLLQGDEGSIPPTPFATHLP